MGETWPDRDVDFEDARSTPQNTARWQAAIDEALSDGSLRLAPTGHRNTYDLEGDCPRCGHEWRSPVSVYYEVKGGPGPGDSFDEDEDPPHERRALRWDLGGHSGRFNIPCSCSKDHGGGVDAGCGWSRDISVTVSRP